MTGTSRTFPFMDYHRGCWRGSVAVFGYLWLCIVLCTCQTRWLFYFVLFMSSEAEHGGWHRLGRTPAVIDSCQLSPA